MLLHFSIGHALRFGLAEYIGSTDLGNEMTILGFYTSYVSSKNVCEYQSKRHQNTQNTYF